MQAASLPRAAGPWRPVVACPTVPSSARPASRRAGVLTRFAPQADGAQFKCDTVEHVMTSSPVHTCMPDDTIDSALEKLVTYRVTGLPVVDASGRVVGVVSDSDLLALHSLGRVRDDRRLFPAADETWQAFKEVKKLLAKTGGQRIRDVMTVNPPTVQRGTGLDEATRVLLLQRVQRLPVVDDQGHLVGILSRGNLVQAAMRLRAAAQAASN